MQSTAWFFLKRGGCPYAHMLCKGWHGSLMFTNVLTETRRWEKESRRPRILLVFHWVACHDNLFFFSSHNYPTDWNCTWAYLGHKPSLGVSTKKWKGLCVNRLSQWLLDTLWIKANCCWLRIITIQHSEAKNTIRTLMKDTDLVVE